jgi:hypothetical protein
MITINWLTKVISIPQADLTSLGGSSYALDVDAFRLQLKALEESEEGMIFPRTHNHNTSVNVGGITLSRVVEIINGYTITFENGSYSVLLSGANSNLLDVVNLNSVSIRSSNSAGLIYSTSSLTEIDKTEIATKVWEKAYSELNVNGSIGKKLVESLVPVGIKKNTAIPNFQIFMTDENDHVSGKVGLSSFTREISKDGGAFTNLSNNVSEIGNGVYKIDLTAGELDADIITLRFAASGADDRVLTIITEG